MTYLQPWSPLVTQQDVSRYWNDQEGLCPHCQQPVGAEHRSSSDGLECWLLRQRRDSRHSFIAYLHVHAKAAGTPPDAAAKMLSDRDLLIRQLQTTFDYDREALLGWCRHHAAERSELAAHRHAA